MAASLAPSPRTPLPRGFHARSDSVARSENTGFDPRRPHAMGVRLRGVLRGFVDGLTHDAMCQMGNSSINWMILFVVSHCESDEPGSGFSSFSHVQPGRKPVASELEVQV